MFSPIEQFDVFVLFTNPLLDRLQIPFTNSSMYVLFATILFCSVLFFGTYNSNLIPTHWQLVVELFFNFIVNLVQEQIGKVGYKYIPFLFVLFFFILACNLMGQVPFGFTPTSHIIITFFISLTIWIACVYIGLITYGIRWFNFFVPDTIPLFILPFFVALEIISYIISAFSLAIRLSANMTAGHTLLHLVATLGVTVAGLGFLLVGISFVLLILILILELAVSFLQAYVFITLVSVYINDSLHLEH